jgi:hypothetical protein
VVLNNCNYFMNVMHFVSSVIADHSFLDNDIIDMFYKFHIISLIALVSGIAHISEAS